MASTTVAPVPAAVDAALGFRYSAAVQTHGLARDILLVPREIQRARPELLVLNPAHTTVVHVAPAPHARTGQRSDCGNSIDAFAFSVLTIGLSVLVVLFIRMFTHA